MLFGLLWFTRLLFSNGLLSLVVVVDPVFVSLLVLVVTLNGCSRDFVDPRLLNFHLRSTRMNMEVFAHAIWISRLFLSDLTVQLNGGGSADGDEGFISENSSSDTSLGSGVTTG